VNQVCGKPERIKISEKMRFFLGFSEEFKKEQLV